MSSKITTVDIETKLLQKIDNDITLFEDDIGTLKCVLQYNSVSKVYIVIQFDTISQENEILCLTKKPTVAAKIYNESILMGTEYE